MPRLISEELAAKLRDCITDDGIILTKKLEKSLTYDEQWSIVMAYAMRVRSQKRRLNTSAAIGSVKALLASGKINEACEEASRVCLSCETPLPFMSHSEAKEHVVELMSVAAGIDTARKRLVIVINALEARFAGENNTLGELYTPSEIAKLVAQMPE